MMHKIFQAFSRQWLSFDIFSEIKGTCAESKKEYPGCDADPIQTDGHHGCPSSVSLYPRRSRGLGESLPREDQCFP